MESLALTDSEIENSSVHSAYYYSESIPLTTTASHGFPLRFQLFQPGDLALLL